MFVLFFFNVVTLEGLGGKSVQVLAVEARTAHDRFGLTHTSSYVQYEKLASEAIDWYRVSSNIITTKGTKSHEGNAYKRIPS